MNVEALAERDKNICHLCRHFVAPKDRSRDHLHPKSQGGYDKGENLKLAHKMCNSARGAMSVEDAYRHIAEFEAAAGRRPSMREVWEILVPMESARLKAEWKAVKVRASVVLHSQPRKSRVFMSWSEEEGRYIEHTWSHW